jgi:hypothetical protein
MNLKFWMSAKAIVEALFGIGFVIMPVYLGSLFGFSLEPAGVLMARLCGAVFIFSSIVLWQSRNEDPKNRIIRSMVAATVISNAIGFVATLSASLAGVWNLLGWFPVALNLAFVVSFGTFLLRKPG